jgi:hypothetical protein
MGYMTCLLARRTPKAKGDCVPGSATAGTQSGTVKAIRTTFGGSAYTHRTNLGGYDIGNFS